ncbi:hypothetical protein [Streptomyces atratus]|uniref:hypothetical protein n=1 Tax=Streptomyces atratus TaxID=1893 RepID=UPI0021A63189|nr:hypothetical protein [Streptomyces atratus]MCT2546244.1 hypothetical protein [Streptomyces atratus]
MSTISIAHPRHTVRAGLADDMTEDDNQRGYERDETENLHQVRHFVADGDRCVGRAGRHVGRPLTRMTG